MKEEELELNTPRVEPAKASTAQLKNTPITPQNAVSITKELLKRDKMVMLKLASTERDKTAQFVGLNGHAYMIPRDKWVKVPAAVVAVLEESSIRDYSVKLEGEDKGKIIESDVNRFSFQTKDAEADKAAPEVPKK